MPRKPRIHYDGALYHVMCRGNNGEEVLKTDKDKRDYIELIKRYKRRYNFKVYAYCIMDNHVHVLIEVSEIPLSKIMQGIQQVYTQRYNRENKRDGHVFQQRYKAILCKKDEYLLNLIRYIHKNPKEAGISEDLTYRWSSHYYYSRNINNDVVDIEFPLSLFAENTVEGNKRYLKFMDEEEISDLKDCVNEYDEIINEIKKEKEGLATVSLEEIIKKIEKICEIKIDDLRKKSRVQKYADTRKAIIILSNKYSDVSNKELGILLNMTESAVSKILSGRYKETKFLNRIIEEVRNKLISQA